MARRHRRSAPPWSPIILRSLLDLIREPESLGDGGERAWREAAVGIVAVFFAFGNATVAALRLWRGVGELAAVAGVGLFGCLAILALVRARAPVRWTGNLLVGLIAIDVTLASLMSGGKILIPYVLAGLFPLTAVVATGRKAGTLWTGFFVAKSVVVAVLHARGVDLPIDRVEQSMGAHVAWIPIAAAFGLAFIVGYESLRLYTASRLREVQHELSTTNEQLRAHQMEHERDLAIARETQQEILPRARLLEDIGGRLGLRVSAVYAPSRVLGGDCWFLRELDSRRIEVYLADFTGHGIGAALNTVRLHALVDESASALHRTDPAAHLDYLNRKLCACLPTGQFAALIYGVVDLAADRFLYSACGATEAIVLRADGEVSFADPQGVPLGITPRTRYETRELRFGAGDHLILYSDGLIETPDHLGVCLSPAGLSELARAVVDDSGPENLAREIYERFLAGVSAGVSDDVTLVCMGRDGRGEGKRERALQSEAS